MGGLSLDVSLYLAWLIPSTFSFLSSCAIIYYILFHKANLKSQLFHQLTILLAIADIIQSGNWFIGVKYSAHYHQCAVQEYLLQFGLVLKACISVIISSVAIYVVQTHKNPRQKVVMQLSGLALVVPCTLIIGSLATHSARLYCNVEIPQYSESSATTQRAIMAYWVVTVFIYFCAALNACLLSSMELKLRVLRLSVQHCTTHQTTTTTRPSQTAPRINNKMMTLITRLRIYPLIFVVFWIPEVIALVTILITGTDQLVLRHVANFCGGCIGLATTASYFYYQEYSTMMSTTTAGSGGSSSSSADSIPQSLSSQTLSYVGRLRSSMSRGSRSGSQSTAHQSTELLNRNSSSSSSSSSSSLASSSSFPSAGAEQPQSSDMEQHS